MALKFYMTPGSCSTGIHILLETLELPFEVWVVNIPAGDHLRPDYLKINPRGTIPTLVLNDGTALTDFKRSFSADSVGTDGLISFHAASNAACARARSTGSVNDDSPDLPSGTGPMELRGSVLRRGAIQMLVVEGRGQPLDASSGLDPAMHEPLGRWRIAGEICDGKCYAGAMRPGSGLAHKACANLCLIGEIPAVFVTVDPVAGSRFLVLAGPEGRPLPADVYDWVGIPVELQGEVERIGNLLVLRLELTRMRRL